MDYVPITFDFEGKQYSGFFTQVSGAGSTAMFHLTVDGFYYGRLRYSEFSHNWCFDATPENEGMKKISDEFGDYITAWYQP